MSKIESLNSHQNKEQNKISLFHLPIMILTMEQSQS